MRIHIFTNEWNKGTWTLGPATTPISVNNISVDVAGPQFVAKVIVVIAMVIVINSVIGRFSWVDLVWLATSTVREQVSDYSLLLENNCSEWFVNNEAADALITFEEIVMAKIYLLTLYFPEVINK